MIGDEDEGPVDEFDHPALQDTGTDASSSVGVKAQERRRDREEKEAIAFWKAVFASPVGRREMWALLAEMHPFDTQFPTSPVGIPHTYAAWHSLGVQQFGIGLYQRWLQRDLSGVMLMQEEHDPRWTKPVKPKRSRAQP